jgi:hypothetical protein
MLQIFLYVRCHIAFRVSIDIGYSHGTYLSKNNDLCWSVKTVNMSRVLYKLTVSYLIDLTSAVFRYRGPSKTTDRLLVSPNCIWEYLESLHTTIVQNYEWMTG